MWWIVGLLLMGVFGRAWLQDNPAGSEQMEEAENARRASDQAIVKFNTDIDDYPHGSSSRQWSSRR